MSENKQSEALSDDQPAAPAQQEPVAWLCEDLILQGRPPLFTDDKEHARLRAEHRDNGKPTWKVTPLYLASHPQAAQPIDAGQKLKAMIEAKLSAARSAVPPTSPALKTWPEEVWLSTGEDEELAQFDEYNDVDWCSEPQNSADVRYVREDVAERAAAFKYAAQPQEAGQVRLPIPVDLLADLRDAISAALFMKAQKSDAEGVKRWEAVDARLNALTRPVAGQARELPPLTPYEFSVDGVYCEWYLKRDVDAILAGQAAPVAPELTDEQIKLVNDATEMMTVSDYPDHAKAVGALLDRYLAAAPPAPAVRVDAKDTERLDFVTEHGAWIAWGRDHEKCRLFHHQDDGESAPMMGWIPEAWASTPRAAIDAAIDALRAAPADKKGGE